MDGRTKAIVEAAERLAKEIGLKPVDLSRGMIRANVDPCTASPEQWHALGALAAALALPAPQWTRTPPSEPGRYWHRIDGSKARLVLIGTPPSPNVGDRYVPEDTASWSVVGGEWWPVPIEEPPA